MRKQISAGIDRRSTVLNMRSNHGGRSLAFAYSLKNLSNLTVSLRVDNCAVPASAVALSPVELQRRDGAGGEELNVVCRLLDKEHSGATMELKLVLLTSDAHVIMFATGGRAVPFGFPMSGRAADYERSNSNTHGRTASLNLTDYALQALTKKFGLVKGLTSADFYSTDFSQLVAKKTHFGTTTQADIYGAFSLRCTLQQFLDREHVAGVKVPIVHAEWKRAHGVARTFLIRAAEGRNLFQGLQHADGTPGKKIPGTQTTTLALYAAMATRFGPGAQYNGQLEAGIEMTRLSDFCAHEIPDIPNLVGFDGGAAATVAWDAAGLQSFPASTTLVLPATAFANSVAG